MRLLAGDVGWCSTSNTLIPSRAGGWRRRPVVAAFHVEHGDPVAGWFV
ncbi:MAG: hypothetical protein OXD37_05240 [Acidimicrobiaceae bacterium]|nr:hypothetical protein [Acidimicrobiaceae bacterium]MCY4175719.1 hypothetical protein [Acidimicrobiaceae bacterium]